ncbi:MAG TPA: hypothetical protein VL947_03155 [Cytophagales bacterium]|nr:hypothetical protein [Cytophagales bacterium]
MKTSIITGIDGSGKSTLLDKLHDEFSANPTIGFFACPSYHHFNSSGYARLSILFEKLNSIGNAYQMPDIKALALYLQMSLYGSVWNHVSRNQLCTKVISERHALIDTVIYGSLYMKSISGNIDAALWKPIIERELNDIDKDAFADILDWISMLNRYTRQDYDFWQYTGFLKEIFSLSGVRVLEHISTYFDLQLPDQVCFLKTDPELALKRLSNRDKPLELHEKPELLQLLQIKYLQLLEVLKRVEPQIQICILEGDNYLEVKEALDLVTEKV